MHKELLPAATARKNFAATVQKISKHKRRLVLTRRNKELVAMVPMSDLATLDGHDATGLAMQAHVRAAVAKMAAGHPVKKVILFGSYARGDFHKGSDIDLLVIKSKVTDWLSENWELRKAFRDALGNYDLDFDLVLVDAKSWVKWKNCYGTVQHEANKEGVVLHE